MFPHATESMYTYIHKLILTCDRILQGVPMIQIRLYFRNIGLKELENSEYLP